METRTALVRIRGLAKTFGEGETRVEAVRGLDLELARGEIVLVWGLREAARPPSSPCSAGRSAPAQARSGSTAPTSPPSPSASCRPSARAPFGFVFQDFNLVAALSARENVEVALNSAGERGRPAHERARALLERMGLANRLDFPVEKLSGGEQRVAIARAIANRPRLILADEPTANLDSAHGVETMRLLRQLAGEEGTTVVIVSHDERLREVADRVLWLEDGRFKALQALVRDPVCGMLLEPERALRLASVKTQKLLRSGPSLQERALSFRSAVSALAATVAAVLVALVLAAAGPAAAPTLPAAGPLATTRVLARERPDPNAKPVHVFRDLRPDFVQQIVFADHAQTGADGRDWVHVQLPMRPNGLRGWIPADSAELKPVRVEIVVRRDARRLEVYRDGQRLFRTIVAVGKPGAETPLGNFYVTYRFEPDDPFYGPFALETSAYSRLSDWPGGGKVGIHGTSMPWLLGKAVSHGCVRVANSAALTLKRLVPVGSKIRIVR